MGRKRQGVSTGKAIRGFYKILYKNFGPQGWWPGRTRFEVIVGAILTQNTAWTNVEKAIRNLRKGGLLTPAAMHASELATLSELIRPAGYFNVKALRLKSFTDHLFHLHAGSLTKLFNSTTEELRRELLDIKGIGPETADSIILYAAGRPEFVVDAYTKRILLRHGFVTEDDGYDEVKAFFMDSLPRDAEMYNEYHALIVRTGKEFCRTKEPRCSECPLGEFL